MIHRTALSGPSALALILSGALAVALPASAHEGAGAIETLADDAAEEGAESETPTMSFGEWGVDPELLSDEIAPGDDFFAYVNQEWLDANPLPAEYSRFGAFNLLREKSTTDVKALMDELTAKPRAELSADERRIVDAYETHLDTAAIDAAGLEPARPYLNEIVAATSLDRLAMIWARPGFASPVGGYVGVDAKQPDRYVANIGIGGLGLPDRDYYLDDSEKGREVQVKYREYIAFLLGEAGYEDPETAAAAIYAFEDRLAREVMWDRTMRRNRDLTYNRVSAEEMAAMSGPLPVTAMMDAMGLSASPTYVVSMMPPSEEKVEELGLDADAL
ncbi:MAG: M13 family metallopeptidase N-terminal domain-containing protein, partial [Parvibaculum sp.]